MTIKRKSHQRKRRLPLQTDLFERGAWGGRRANAGRKRASSHRSTPHVVRPRHAAAHPVHVTLRALERDLRRASVLAALERQVQRVRDANQGFVIAHYSLQDNHLHLIVEARDKRALSRGMLGFASALGRAVNKLRSRCGKFWAHRYHARELTSPLAVRRALVYVLRNARKHGGGGASEDAFSSAQAFRWFRGAFFAAWRAAGRVGSCALVGVGTGSFAGAKHRRHRRAAS